MSGHFDAIGFRIATSDDLVSLIDHILPVTERIRVASGFYHRWNGANGEEVWIQSDEHDAVTGANPHYSGQSQLHIRITAHLVRPDDAPLDGGFIAELLTGTGESQQMEYPIVFDAPDARTYEDLVPGFAEVQITAFAHEVKMYANDAAFLESQAGAQIKFGAQSFIPIGMFGEGAEGLPPTPQPEAMFTGTVVDATTHQNLRTGESYHWALVETLGGRYDVVIDPSLLAECPPVGSILSGLFWMSGRLLSYTHEKRGWFGRLFHVKDE